MKFHGKCNFIECKTLNLYLNILQVIFLFLHSNLSIMTVGLEVILQVTYTSLPVIWYPLTCLIAMAI